MKAMLLAFVTVGVIAVAAWFGLHEYAGFSSADRTITGDSVRLD